MISFYWSVVVCCCLLLQVVVKDGAKNSSRCVKYILRDM